MREPLRHFNSIKVQLEPTTFLARRLFDKFQFHKGTIRTNYLEGKNEVDLHFNSIKVQLEPIYAVDTPFAVIQFQFHKGTIRTALSRRYTLYVSHFNSIKVQLERFLRYDLLYT